MNTSMNDSHNLGLCAKSYSSLTIVHVCHSLEAGIHAPWMVRVIPPPNGMSSIPVVNTMWC